MGTLQSLLSAAVQGRGSVEQLKYGKHDECCTCFRLLGQITQQSPAVKVDKLL